MSMNIDPTGSLSSVSDASLGGSKSVQLIFAQLQMELAASNKEMAIKKIETIRDQQAESKEITEAINKLRDCKLKIESDKDVLHIGKVSAYANCTNEELEAHKNDSAEGNDQQRQEYFEVAQLCNDYGITWKTTNITKADIDEMIASLEDLQEEKGSDIQQQMIFVQDYMGQYNSYTQGASSAISDASETLKTVARG
ncbi:MAG: hypothetical protein IAB19_08050 [Proteobacteria bacterium]|uniref:Uncharacterized protein n=1 Tax=Candidatus Avisuccinivibrio stercorigallinarum TaxID=2840704 RepID=A0A9D9DAW2_9GAMM|nr:hypothetical protein [Candidatus Avisuccinivibrio stercorigallinarum]